MPGRRAPGAAARADAPVFKPDELESAIRQAEKDHEIVLEADQRRAIATALTCQVSVISGGPGVGKTTSVRILVELLERRGVQYVLLSPTGKAAKRLSEATLRDAYTIHRQLFSLDRQRLQLEPQSRGQVDLFLPGDAVIVDEASMAGSGGQSKGSGSHRAKRATGFSQAWFRSPGTMPLGGPANTDSCLLGARAEGSGRVQNFGP